MQKNERWGPTLGVGGNPSARLRAARSMPQWMESRGGLPSPPPPPPEPEPITTDPDYEVIDVPGQAYSNTPLTTIEVRLKRCELCGASGPSVQCEQCPQQSFCPSCDEMYHRHPKRQSHVRRAIMDMSNRPGEPPRPPLPPKGEGLVSPAPVPPPRRNKKNLLPPGSTNSLKRETGFVGSLKRIITGKSLPPPRPPPMARDRSTSLMNNNLDFHRSQMMMGEMENGWGRGMGIGGRMGSMTGLNMAPNFAPMMHAQSMAHLGCPGCQGWGWGSQAALHQAGMHGGGHPGMHPHHHHGHPHGSMHGGMHMPPPPQPFWYPSWDPRRHRRSHHGRTVADSSSEDEQPSPALSRRSIRAVDSDSDDSFKKSRPHSRRDSLVDIRRREDDMLSMRGGRHDDDTRSLRGQRRDSLRRREDVGPERGDWRSRRFDDTVSERGGARRSGDAVSERGGVRRRQDELLGEDRIFRRKDDDTFSERGGRRLSNRTEGKYRDDSWERGSRRTEKDEGRYQQENSWNKSADKRRDKYLIDSDSDKRIRSSEDKKQERIPDPPKNKDEKKNGIFGANSSTKSSETISSIISSTSGEDRAKSSKKDRVFSDTGQRRRATLDIVNKEESPKPADEDDLKESEEAMKPLGNIPTTDWECQHCTYVNRPGSRVCEVCCKTKTLGNVSPSPDTVTVFETPVEPEIKEEAKVEPKPEEPKKKETQSQVEAANGTQSPKNVSLSTKGTSPPPQSISTQTYDVAGLTVKKTTSSDVGWTSPRRSFSRQSMVSETAQSGISPPRSSPGETDSQITDTKQQVKRSDLGTSTLTRKASRAGSLVSEQINTMVQKQVNQGLEMVKLLREAEEVGFSGEEVSVAVEHCGDSNPLQWLLDNWAHMIDTVVTLATNYGHERKENTIGTVSEREARAALITHQGSVWSAVTEVVQQRQNKYGELLSRGNFSREDIVTALTAHHGDLDAAYTELTKGQLKPFLRRIWAPNNHIGEMEEPRPEWDTAGRVQSWLTQHVYQSVPKTRQTLPQPNRRHSDVHRFLTEVLGGQSDQSTFGDNRYASLHSLTAGRNGIPTKDDFGAPPERYTSCLNLHEASTLAMAGPRLYSRQQRPSYPSRNLDDIRNIRFGERHISVPDHLQEYKDKILLYDKIQSPPSEFLYDGIEFPTSSQNSKWENLKIPVFRSDSQTDEPSEGLEDSKSEEVHLDDEVDTNDVQDEVYNGRLQLLVQRNHRRKRRPRKALKHYHSKFNVKSDVKPSKIKMEENKLKSDHVVVTSEKPEITKQSFHPNKEVTKPKKESTDEYESIDSSDEETPRNKNVNNDRNTIQRRPVAKNERIITIQREVSDNEEADMATPDLGEVLAVEVTSDLESVSKSHSEEFLGTDYKELEGSFSNSIPYIDDAELFSDASEEIQNIVTKRKHQRDGKMIKSKGGSKSDDSSRYLSSIEWSESEKPIGVLSDGSAGKKENENSKKTGVSMKENDTAIKPHAETGKAVTKTVNFPKVLVVEHEQIEEYNLYSSDDQKNGQMEPEETSSEEDEYIEIEDDDVIAETNEDAPPNIPCGKNASDEKDVDTKSKIDGSQKSGEKDSKSGKSAEAPADQNRKSVINEKVQLTDHSIRDVNKEISQEVLEQTEESKQLTEQPTGKITDNKKSESQIQDKSTDKKIEPPNNTGAATEITENKQTEENVNKGNERTHDASEQQMKGTPEITVRGADDVEKGCSDEKSHEKSGPQSENSNSDDVSQLSTFASGNVKTKIKVEVNRLSPVADVDESSDIDVSPIPTDSEGDKTRSSNKRKSEVITTVKDKRDEMATLIKESLSKDIVLDRLVGTLLGVLQAGGTTNIFKEQDLAAVFHQDEIRGIKEVAVGADHGLVSALQIAQDINVNPKEAIQETLLQCDTIKHSSEVVKDEKQIKNDEFQREVRKVLAEGLVTSYAQAELVVNLTEMKFTQEEAVQAAAECTSLQTAISFLHQECPLCANKCTIKQMVGMLECDHRCCKECAFNYFNLQVTEGSVWDCVCPFCRLPNLKIATQDQAQLYFSHLDILLKGILQEATHELFQRKLRDWTLAQDPNFKWCTKCSSGFIANPHQKILMCPDCRSITCAQCRKPWEGAHEGRTCEQYAQHIEPEPDHLLDKHLEEEGITCPSCKARYSLARGGCMHMTCTSCKHEFCSGCAKPFLMGERCQVSEYCHKLGLHAHHPRNCLFYLRDKEPQILEQLLKENNIDFSRDSADQSSNTRCKVSLLKETDDGMIETECSHAIHAQALCRSHYVEHLVRLVRDRKLDPVTVMDLTEAQQELRRRGKQLPDRLPRQCDQSYLQVLIKVVQEQIPLE